MDAVVIAAGEGRRLRPLTERWPKPLLPIDGRPVLATLLHELRAAGFDEAWLVVGHLGERIARLLGDGSAFGLRIRYAHQPTRRGSADAVSCALAAGARPPLLVSAADTVYRPGDVARMRARLESTHAQGGLGVRRLAPPELRHQTRVRVEDGLLVELGETGGALGEEGERERGGVLTGAPLWFLGPSLVDRLGALPGPPYELADAARGAIEAGERVVALELGRTRDLTSPEDIVLRNFAYLWVADDERDV